MKLRLMTFLKRLKSMKRLISPGLLPAIINLPSSKSYANRALILAALKPGSQTIHNLSSADDVLFLISALKKIGLQVEQEGGKVTILNSFPACETDNVSAIEVGEGGTTARFLSSMLLCGSRPYTLILGKRLKDRPWDEFITEASLLGAKIELRDNLLTIQGPVIFPKKLEVDCARTTQFASGLQLVSAFSETEIIPLNMNSSADYWSMTKDLIEHFKQKSDFHIPLDWSSASYPLAFAALKQEVFFPGLFIDSFQADSKFGLILKDVGVMFESSLGITVKPYAVQKNFSLDVSGCLDLVPALSFYLAHVDGFHKLRGIENLVHKESDRLTEVLGLLKAFKIDTCIENNELVIHGDPDYRFHQPLDLEMKDDHRMVMTAALFLRFYDGGTIVPSEAVNKSYPDFFSLMS